MNTAATGSPMLSVQGVHTFYGAIEALKGVSLEVFDGEIVTLVGSNGAGKTTTMRTIHGLLKPKQGTITFLGQDVTSERTDELVRRGMSQSPEGRRVFPRMTVRENLEMGAFQRSDGEIESDIAYIYELFPRLQERKAQKAGLMSGGEQQMLAMGRAMMARPKLLMLDEPSMGLAPLFIQRIFETIVEVNKRGVTVLLVEQNANVALEISNRGYVLESGNVVLTGTGEELLANDEIRKAYLGEE
jgi:branched-chain amino acid transport system ATP-binding protein